MTFDFYTNTEGNSPLYRLDARIKIIIAVATIFGVVLMGNWWIPLIVFGSCIAFLFYSRAPAKVYFKRLLYPIYIIIFIAIVYPFTMISSNIESYLPILGWPIYAEGLKFGILIFTRCLSAVAVLNLLILITPMEKILDSMRWFKIPTVITDTMMLMFRYISLLSEESNRIRKAQESRLGYSKKLSISKKIANFGTLAGMLVARSFDRAIQVGDAMVSRCYTGTSNMFYYSKKKLPREDTLIGVLAILGIVGILTIDHILL